MVPTPLQTSSRLEMRAEVRSGPIASVRRTVHYFRGAVFGTGDHTGTGQTGGGVSGCYRADGEQRCDLDRRRASKARAGRAPVQPYPGQADENSSVSLGVHKIPSSKGMAGSHRGLASYSRNKQGRPPICNRDEKIRCGGVSAVLKTAAWRQSEGGL